MTSSMILSGLKVNGDDKREARKMREKERDMEEEGKKEGGGGMVGVDLCLCQVLSFF